EGGAPVDDSGWNEDRRAESVLLQDGQRLVGHVAKAVVEAKANGGLHERMGAKQVHGLDDVEDAIAALGQQLHLLAKALRRDRKLVPVVRDPVVEEQAQARSPVRLSPRAREPGERTGPRHAGLERIGESGGRAQRPTLACPYSRAQE